MRRRYVLIGFLPLILLATPFVVIELIALIQRERQFARSERLLEEVLAETTRIDPQWQLRELQQSLSDVPDSENSFLKIATIKGFLGATLGQKPTFGGFFGEEEDSPNQLWSEEEVQELRLHQQLFKNAVPLARDLEKFPRGRQFIPIGADPFVMTLRHPQEMSEVATLIKCEIELLLHDQKPSETFPFLRSMLVAADSMGEDMWLLSHLLKNRIRGMFVTAVQRTLALSEPSAVDLLSLLETVRSATASNHLRMGLRGERALTQLQFEFIAKNPADMVIALTDFGLSSGFRHQDSPKTLREYQPLFKGDHAKIIRFFNRLIESSQLPFHEFRAVADEVVREAQSPTTPLANNCLRSIGQSIEVEQRNLAFLACAETAICCELFRLQNQRWPNTLEEIPKDWLPKIPLNPYDGQILQLHRTKTGLWIGSLDPNRVYEADHRYALKASDSLPNRLYGVELFNPDQRRLPPPPPQPEALQFPRELDADANDSKE